MVALITTRLLPRLGAVKRLVPPPAGRAVRDLALRNTPEGATLAPQPSGIWGTSA